MVQIFVVPQLKPDVSNTIWWNGLIRIIRLVEIHRVYSYFFFNFQSHWKLLNRPHYKIQRSNVFDKHQERKFSCEVNSYLLYIMPKVSKFYIWFQFQYFLRKTFHLWKRSLIICLLYNFKKVYKRSGRIESSLVSFRRGMWFGLALREFRSIWLFCLKNEVH